MSPSAGKREKERGDNPAGTISHTFAAAGPNVAPM
jgi:hypothetical protein